MIQQEVKATFRLAGPLILAQLAQMSMSFVDTLMVGRLGSRELASVALGGAIFYPIVIVCLGVLLAVSPMVSQSFGAGQWVFAGRAVRQGLWLALVLAVPAMFLMWNAWLVLVWMGHPGEIIEQARDYLHAIVWGVPALFFFGVLRQLAEGVSRPRIVMVVTIGGVALNIVANYALMFGKLGFPALGLVGCGWASTLVYWSMAATLVAFLAGFADFRSYAVFSRLGKPDWQFLAEILRIGWPIGIMQFLEVSLFAASGMMMGLFSTTQLAAHQVALNCAAYVFMIPLGLSFAVSIRVGQAVGRQDLAGLRRAGLVGIGLGAGVMTFSALTFWTAPTWVMGLFLEVSDPENQPVLQRGAALLAIAAVFQIFDGIQVTAAGALRGLKVTRVPMIVAVVSYWGVGFNCAWYFGFVLGHEGSGLWWGLVMGLATAAVLLTWRFVVEVSRLSLDDMEKPPTPFPPPAARMRERFRAGERS